MDMDNINNLWYLVADDMDDEYMWFVSNMDDNDEEYDADEVQKIKNYMEQEMWQEAFDIMVKNDWGVSNLHDILKGCVFLTMLKKQETSKMDMEMDYINNLWSLVTDNMWDEYRWLISNMDDNDEEYDDDEIQKLENYMEEEMWQEALDTMIKNNWGTKLNDMIKGCVFLTMLKKPYSDKQETH